MIFIDTNVLIYATVTGAPFQPQARAATAACESGAALCVGRQILREYLAVVTRPQVWGRPLALAEGIADTTIFAQRFTILEDGVLVWSELVRLGQRFALRGASYTTRTSSPRCSQTASTGC